MPNACACLLPPTAPQVESKARHADDVRKDVELASIEADKILADQVELDLRVKVRARRGRGEGGRGEGHRSG